MVNSYDFDAIVIGSGISGGWAAKELTEKGLKVLMLDRGRMVEHGDYPTENKGPWELPFRGKLPPEVVERDYFMAKWGGADKSDRAHHFINDRENPYAHEDGKAFRWIRPNQVGGKSLMWSRMSYRWNRYDFEANKLEGNGLDWPVRYDEMAPWYSYVEKYAGIAGSKEGLEVLPDGEFQRPHPMNEPELWAKKNLESAMPNIKLIHVRSANMTEDKPEQGRSRCQSRSQCERGCSFGAYFSTQSATLPAARATGNLTLMSDTICTRLLYDEVGKKIAGVQVLNTQTRETATYRSRIVFLCASAMASLQILMNSRLEGRNDSFANRSGTLGRYVMDHIFRVYVTGRIPGFEDQVEYGRRPAGVYVPRFRNIGKKDADSNFYRGYGLQGGAGRGQAWPQGFGADMKKQMRQYGAWHMRLSAFGECLPYRDNQVSLHPTKVDRFGIPQLVFNVTFRDNEYRMMEDALQKGQDILKAAGCVDVKGQQDDHVPGDAIHEMGGARMGENPNESVVNRWSQCHDAPNLFITDGAQMTSNSCVNPSLTFMAFTARAADYAAKQVKAGIF